MYFYEVINMKHLWHVKPGNGFGLSVYCQIKVLGKPLNC